MSAVPVITIDGPSASGKGTVAQRTAKILGFHYLDSGALYRLTALAAAKLNVLLDDEAALAKLASALDLKFTGEKVFLAGTDVSSEIRSEACADGASRVAVLAAVRDALLARQRAFLAPPGLVADGRDMGSVVFPAADLKIFLIAAPEVRAQRRYKQLKEKGMDASLEDILQEIRSRDARDASRSIAPLKLLPGAKLLDTSKLTIDEAVGRILHWYAAKETGA